MSGQVIIIGGGHNGLTAAAYLAKAGRKVRLFEANDQLGGLARSEVFHEGFSSPGLLHDASAVRPWVVSDLKLRSHGLRYAASPTRFTAPGPDGDPIYLEGGAVSGAVSGNDAERFSAFAGFIERLRKPLMRILDTPPPDPLGPLLPLIGPLLGIRRLGAKDMTELIRVPPMASADWMRDAFGNDRLGAAVAHRGLIGSWTGPWSPWTSAALLFDLCASGADIWGGPAALADALGAAAASYGAEINTGAPVARILTDLDGVTGIELADGERIEGQIVASTCDPRRTFLEMVGRRALTSEFSRSISNVRLRGTTAKLDLAIEGRLEDAKGVPVVRLQTGDSLNDLERSFDPIKYNEMSETPLLDARALGPDDGGCCPQGHQVVSILVHYAPYALKGGWTDTAKATLTARTLDVLRRACPGVADQIIGHRLTTPADLERRYGLTEGHIFHGEHAPDQLMSLRPTVETGRYTTPIGGLFLCGSGSHPGGGITCAPGALGAKTILAKTT